MFITAMKYLKNALVALAVSVLMINCSDDDPRPEDVSLVGEWKLREILMDPGDGSGEFQKVDSDKIIEFFENGNVESNGNLCNGGITTGRPSSGIYKVPDSILELDNCEREFRMTRFRLEDGDLILSYPCIEPCEEKYIKLD